MNLRGKLVAQSWATFLYSLWNHRNHKNLQNPPNCQNLIICTILLKKAMNQMFRDLLDEGSKIINARPRDKEFNKEWRSFFGCSPQISMLIWVLLERHSLLPPSPQCRHLLWALLLLKTYAHDRQSCKLVGGCDLKTWRKHSWGYIEHISNLEAKVVSWLVLHINYALIFLYEKLNIHSIK